MATYKVLQDIEAEDKFLGPLTLKQFILACITVVTGFLCFYFFSKGWWILDLPLLPILFFSGFLAFPWGRDQPTEVWLLAKISFMLKPRGRIWDQTGMKELVTITAPKHLADQFVGENISPNEVKSRLKALADTIDSRGWAIKNVNLNLYTDPGYGMVLQPSDRLVDASTLAQDVLPVDINPSDDIMDEQSNLTAQHLDQMITSSTQSHHQTTMQQLQAVRNHISPAPGTIANDARTETLTPEEKALLDKQRSQVEHLTYGNTRVIDPHATPKPAKHSSGAKHAGKHKATKAASHTVKHTKTTGSQTMTRTPDPAIINLANNDDLSVATIARQANQKPKQEPSNGEVIISLR